MPNTREKLIEICFHEFCCLAGDTPCGCDGCPYGQYGSDNGECYEAYKKQKEAKIIANGVTFATDNNVGDKWISVKDRLPELHTKVLCCGIKGGRFIAELSTWGKEKHLCWDKRDGKGCPAVTHWMPLPEPPKEGDS